MKIALYNQEGKETGEITLPKEIFQVPMNLNLVHQVLVSQQGNMRQNSAHAKDRSEVRGGGKKPWRQKGTGRARHGSIRSPLWKGGGVTGGPRNERNFDRDIPKKMNRKALFMVLSEKVKNNLLIVLEKIETSGLSKDNIEKSRSQNDRGSSVTKSSGPKTKIMSEMIKKLPAGNASRLVLHKNKRNIYLASRNIKKTGVLEARNLNITDLMNYKYILTDKEGIEEIKKTFAKQKSESEN